MEAKPDPKRWAMYAVLILVTAALTSLLRPFDAQAPTVNAQAGCRAFPETGQVVCGKFLQY